MVVLLRWLKRVARRRQAALGAMVLVLVFGICSTEGHATAFTQAEIERLAVMIASEVSQAPIGASRADEQSRANGDVARQTWLSWLLTAG